MLWPPGPQAIIGISHRSLPSGSPARSRNATGYEQRPGPTKSRSDSGSERRPGRFDANHQLAGQDLIFDLELVEVKSPSTE